MRVGLVALYIQAFKNILRHMGLPAQTRVIELIFFIFKLGGRYVMCPMFLEKEVKDASFACSKFSHHEGAQKIKLCNCLL
jgi:hypothetical protein